MTDKQRRFAEKLKRYYKNADDYNYAQLTTKMQNDKRFEEMILSMTIDRIMGGSALAKYKYHFDYRKR